MCYNRKAERYCFETQQKNFGYGGNFPLEEILSFKQLYYLIIIMIIYFCIMNFFFNVFYNISAELFLVNSIIDILFSVYIAVSYYDGSTKSKILCIFLMPLASLSSLMFGRSIILFWDFIRIPTLMYMVVHSITGLLSSLKKTAWTN